MKKLFTLLFSAIVFVAQAQINLGLVGKFYFTLGSKDNEVNIDHSLYDGLTGFSNPTPTADRFGNANHAYYFNGSAAFYYYNTSSPQTPDFFDLNNMDAVSFSVWVKPDANSLTSNRCILARWNSDPFKEQFLLELTNSANTLVAIRVVNANGDYDTTSYATGQWHHIVFTYNKNDNNRHKIYVNGALKYNQTFTGVYANSSSNTPFLIGLRSNGFNGFLGAIDDINIYNKALTDAEVTCLYNEPDPTTTSPVTLGVTLSASPTSVCVGNPVTLTATPSGAVANYSWDAGNGNPAITSTTATATATPTFSSTYTVKVTDASGCYGAMASVVVPVYDLPLPTIVQNANTLNTQTFSSYQWRLNGNDINGATAQNYTATQNGSYTVRVTDANGCSNTSAAVNVTVSSLSEVADFSSVIFPNPTSNVLHIDCSEDIQAIEVADVTGRIIIAENNLSTRNLQLATSILAEATYFIHIKTTTGKTAVKSFAKQ
ncbi:MAG: PKD domain-containing protein [Chitinophagales bacterium]|nr:PKD domain-containing protein [Chitinophagales bacterium]